jgi:hypothetical protein
MQEIWKDIAGFEGYYQISNLGQVQSLHYKKNKLLTPVIHNKGYLTVILSNNTRKKHYTIHRLIALHFVLNSENKPCVNHKDGNKLNNRVENLEWCTYAENTQHAFKYGLQPQTRLSKLTNANIQYIIKYIAKKNKHELAKQFNISLSHIRNLYTKFKKQGLVK